MASRALRLSKDRTDSDTPTRRTKSRSRSRSRSPTPFDNVAPGEKPPGVRVKPDLSKLFDVHHHRPNEIVRSFPFGPVKGVRYHNVQAGRNPQSTPAITPTELDPQSLTDKTPDGTKNGDFKTPKFSAGPSAKEQQMKLAMEPHNRTLMRRVVSNLKTNKPKKRWQMILDVSFLNVEK